MNPMDLYRKKMTSNNHPSLDTTNQLLDESFKDSPLYREVDVRAFGFHENINSVEEEFKLGVNDAHELKDNVEISWTPFFKEGVRFNTDRKGQKELLMRSDHSIHLGDIIKADNKYWMVRVLSDKQTYPKAMLDLCTVNVPININGEDFNEPCIVSSGRHKIDFEENSNRYMLLDTSRIQVSIQYNSFSKNIKELDEFWIGGKHFKLIGIDMISDVYDRRGVINLEFERYSHNPKDSSGDKWESGW